MDKEREIKELAKIIYESGVALNGTDFAFGVSGDDHFTKLAKKLIEAGYGDTKQAVREFVKELRKRIDKIRHPNERVITNVLEEEYEETIDELLAEVTGE